jgi:8-oxo-dGTP pyrophosphatase MutT (NUDIX family)
MPDYSLPEQLARTLERPFNQPFPRRAPAMAYGRHQGPPRPDARVAAVLILLYPIHDAWHLPLTVRQPHLSIHAGQVSLPGGGVEIGESSRDAACREAEEELGIPTHDVRIVGQLPTVYLFNSNYHVTPWIGFANQRPKFRVNEDEVSELIELPLSAINHDDFQSELVVQRGRLRFTAPALRWQSHQIWGATRLILAQFAECIAEAARPEHAETE